MKLINGPISKKIFLKVNIWVLQSTYQKEQNLKKK